MSAIRFESKLVTINSWVIVKIPRSASVKLPTRGMTMVEGAINSFHFQAAAEPDGKGSHWFRVDNSMLKGARAKVGDSVTIAMEPAKEWSEPVVPADLKKALSSSLQANKVWHDITPSARWDWIRWISSTKNPETRRKRIDVTFSKFKAGKRRPCCFNRTICTEIYVSDKGVLLEPEQAIVAKMNSAKRSSK